MIHIRPLVKIHPTQNTAIPTFSRSHPQPETPPHHEVSLAAPAPILTTVFTHEEIAERAYALYVQNGRHDGHCLQNWQQAENDLRHQGLLACHSEHVVADVFAPDAVEPK